MILLVGEKCLTVTNDGTEYYALREYRYKTDEKTLLEAHKDLEENFDSDNVIWSEDYFSGKCLDSEIIKVEIEYN